MRIKLCPTESFARDYFKNQGVEHYWDQAYSGAVMEATEAIWVEKRSHLLRNWDFYYVCTRNVSWKNIYWQANR